jgi:hypothetical protein
VCCVASEWKGDESQIPMTTCFFGEIKGESNRVNTPLLLATQVLPFLDPLTPLSLISNKKIHPFLTLLAHLKIPNSPHTVLYTPPPQIHPQLLFVVVVFTKGKG